MGVTEMAAVVLAFVCGVLVLRIYALERDLRAGARQLKKRREEGGGASLRMAAPNAAAEALLSEINILLRAGEDDRAAFRQRERALREQIANISHDLRTPLTSIVGYLQLLDAPGVTEEQRREYLDVIVERSRALQELIGSFYDLSRLEAGEYPIQREKVDLREVISRLLAAFYNDLEARFQVEVDLPEDLPAVWGDPAALNRVYSNLIRNALEHGSGTLNISARRAGERVETRFTNGGADLSPEQLPHVFERTFTSDRTRSGRNAGLGLAIVKALCDQMGGQARAELSGEGFTVALTWKI